MTALQRLQKKRTKRIIGLMSGTSVDGIDAALIDVRGNGTGSKVRVRAFATYPFPRGFRELVLANSLAGTGSVDLICRLNILYAHFYADAVRKIARKADVALSSIDLIGSHGQTVHHLPAPHRMFGKKIRATLQIGDPSTLAKLTGIPTVGDFRTADMAVGGQGAPLVPYVDYLLFRSKTKNRILLNLGGIANFTALPRNSGIGDVVAFDTGPANMVIDAMMAKLYGKRHDEAGRIGMGGEVVPALLRWMMKHPYLREKPPKSTGRELFGESFLRRILGKWKKERREDLVATAAAYTAASIHDQYHRFIAKRMRVDEILVSGGGMHNLAIMHRLEYYFAPAKVRPLSELGIDPDAKEAICFAVLANETIAEHPANVTRVTGASRAVVLGKICL
ncbi:MAG: anhydro-N-acetylmuramic acid kinase [Ignavibacteria bacterium]|nr:anhydro-N-acetylmuramic acid kinase [Ignavibacteria bacterium]